MRRGEVLTALADEDGLTLVELVLAVFVLAAIAAGTSSAALAVSRWVDVGAAELQQAASYGRALQVLGQDLRQPALAGVSISGATYNTANTLTLSWTDQTTAPVTAYTVSYAISGTDLVRTVTATQGASTTTTSFAVARGLDAAGASGGAQFSRSAGSPGVVRTLLTIKVGTTSTTYDFTVEQRP
jgi:type II secretory pathway pseudopilin PulG